MGGTYAASDLTLRQTLSEAQPHKYPYGDVRASTLHRPSAFLRVHPIRKPNRAHPLGWRLWPQALGHSQALLPGSQASEPAACFFCQALGPVSLLYHLLSVCLLYLLLYYLVLYSYLLSYLDLRLLGWLLDLQLLSLKFYEVLILSFTH